MNNYLAIGNDEYDDKPMPVDGTLMRNEKLDLVGELSTCHSETGETCLNVVQVLGSDDTYLVGVNNKLIRDTDWSIV